MDKRESVRVPVHLRARCRSPGIQIDGFVEDVSRSGLFLRASNWMRPGAEGEIWLDLPEGSLSLSISVVRVEHSQARAGMGLRFADGIEANRPLANFIMQQHAESRW